MSYYLNFFYHHCCSNWIKPVILLKIIHHMIKIIIGVIHIKTALM